MKLGLPGVHVKSAEWKDDEFTFSNINAIETGGDAIYVRGYATMNGKTSYSQYVYQLEKNGEGVYTVVKSLRIDEERVTRISTTPGASERPPSCGSTARGRGMAIHELSEQSGSPRHRPVFHPDGRRRCDHRSCDRGQHPRAKRRRTRTNIQRLGLGHLGSIQPGHVHVV
ncbi:MAG: hypothetical protein MZU97_08395 [Bacillus subtilis]|nr:hypothetical protein [Bacillus subtilis]